MQPRALDHEHAPRVELLAAPHHIGDHAWRQPGCPRRREAADERAIQVKHDRHATLQRWRLHQQAGVRNFSTAGYGSLGAREGVKLLSVRSRSSTTVMRPFSAGVCTSKEASKTSRLLIMAAWVPAKA